MRRAIEYFRKPTVLAALVLSMALIAGAQPVPNDAKPTCTVTTPMFDSWFQSGTPTLNGVVNPANSVTFANTADNCIFYQWSKQMFLWLTSPAPVTYGGGGGRIFDSPTFYDVSPPDAMGQRTFIPHTSGFLHFLGVRAAQVGPHGLPVVMSKAGQMLEVERALTAPSGKQLIRTKAGELVEINQARIANGKLVFLDAAGKTIQPLLGSPVKTAARKANVTNITTVQRFIIGGIPIFIDPSGNVIDVEQGQAGGNDVLLAQNGSLIYYATIVNDVYAYFLTGAKNGGITPAPTQFPTTQAELNKVVAFAASHSKTFPDPNALAIEIKSSWIEAAGLPNLSSYITMNATIPTYDKTNPNQWVANGQKNVQLALVGMHVVGSTNGHPEMVWATFEHFNNTPNATYTYVNSSNVTKTVAQATAGAWLFTANGSDGPFNVSHAVFNSPDINATPTHSITASDTMRWKAWGAASDVVPNPLIPSTAASNTQVIAIHNSVSGMMPAGDVRNNYLMTGATWTIGGASPTFGNPPNHGNQVGTSLLSNSTMETYQQGIDNTAAHGGSNCFSCHTSNTTGVSHVFGGLKPLFP